MPLLKTLVAFANSAGGKLIFGVEDSRKVVGVDEPLDQEERLCNLIADSIAPRLVPNIELATVSDKTVLVVEVFLSNSRPHFIKAEGPANGVYVRLGSTNRKAGPELIAELQRGVAGISFDSTPMPHLSLEDLDLKAIQNDFSEKKINEKTLKSLKLITLEQGKAVPTIGGIILYGLERRFHFDDAWVQCGRFVGNDKGDIFDHIDIHDPLPFAAESIMLFLKKHAMRGADFSELRRKDIWSIPLNVMREVIINALVHADYSTRGTPIRVAYFDNRIEVESPGLLMPGMTIEDMKLGVSKIRNPVIARIFKELELIEQWGSGLPGIFREIKVRNLPEPKIEELSGRVRFTVFLIEPQTVTPDKSRKTHSKNNHSSNSRQSDKIKAEKVIDEQVSEQVGEQVEIVLQACKDKPLTKKELLKKLNLANVYLNYKRHLKPLIDKGFVEPTIPEKPTSRLQKYRLTNKGRLLLKQLEK